jgi:hypothetical protein
VAIGGKRGRDVSADGVVDARSVSAHQEACSKASAFHVPSAAAGYAQLALAVADSRGFWITGWPGKA